MGDRPALPATVQDDCSGPYDAWLLPRLRMRPEATSAPVRTARAKLGGQPVWLGPPTWPLSRSSGEPMMFVGQFPVPTDGPGLAYLFVTDDPECTAATFEPEAGENALLVQPGGRVPPFVRTGDTATGPSLWRRGATWDEHVGVELAVDLVPLDPAVETALDAEIEVGRAERAGVRPDLPDGLDIVSPAVSYLGGRVRLWQPQVGVQGIPADWRFHFLLDGGEGYGPEDPYALNFGGGSGYGFLSPDLREGRFFWDCT